MLWNSPSGSQGGGLRSSTVLRGIGSPRPLALVISPDRDQVSRRRGQRKYGCAPRCRGGSPAPSDDHGGAAVAPAPRRSCMDRLWRPFVSPGAGAARVARRFAAGREAGWKAGDGGPVAMLLPLEGAAGPPPPGQPAGASGHPVGEDHPLDHRERVIAPAQQVVPKGPTPAVRAPTISLSAQPPCSTTLFAPSSPARPIPSARNSGPALAVQDAPPERIAEGWKRPGARLRSPARRIAEAHPLADPGGQVRAEEAAHLLAERRFLRGESQIHPVPRAVSCRWWGTVPGCRCRRALAHGCRGRRGSGLPSIGVSAGFRRSGASAAMLVMAAAPGPAASRAPGACTALRRRCPRPGPPPPA